MNEACHRRFPLNVGILLTIGCLGVAAARADEPARLTKTTHTYKTVGALPIRADVYRTEDTQTRPVVVWIHGGALISGNRHSVPKNLLELCSAEGYALVSLDYRLAPEVKLPEIITDLEDAFRWLREKGPTLLHIDSDRLVVTGGSAGGYLTLMAGLRVQPKPRALVAYWGYGDVDGDWYTKPSEHYRKQPLVPEKDARSGVGGAVTTGSEPSVDMRPRGRFYLYLRQHGLWTKEVTGFDPQNDRAKLDPFCPVRNVTPDYPPTMLVHGTEDTDVPYALSVAMAKELERHKVPHELATVPGAGHGLSGGDAKLVNDAHAKALAFIRTHLNAKQAQRPSWQGKPVILTRAGVELQAPEGKSIAPKSSGVAKDLTFRVEKEETGRLLIDSRRQRGWISKNDAIPFEQALAHFTNELARDPKNAHSFTARGVVLSSGKDRDKAVVDFDKAIELDPKAILAFYHRANLAYGKGQYDKALADYNTVIQQDPDFDWAYHVRGWIYYRRMDYDKALADYAKAIKLVPTETVFYRDRGNVAFVRKQYDAALADYSRSIELDPTYTVPWQLRGRTWEAKKEYAKALADYEKAVQLAGKESYYSGYHTSLALLLAACPDARIRDGKRALAVAQKAYELSKGPNELATLAAAHAELGEFDKAVDFQTQAIAVAPRPLIDQYQQRLKLYEAKKPYRFE